MAATAEDIRKYLLQLDKDSNVTVDDVKQKLLGLVDGLIQKNKVARLQPESPVNHLAVDSALIDETLDEIEDNEHKYDMRERTPEVSLTEEEFEDDVPKKKQEFWTNLDNRIKACTSSIVHSHNLFSLQWIRF